MRIRTLALGCAGFVVIGYALLDQIGLPDLVRTNQEWVDTVQIQTSGNLDGALFQKMTDAGLIWIERVPHDVRLIRPTCSTAATEDPGRVPTLDGKQAKDHDRLVSEFCNTEVGQRIQITVDMLNAGGGLVAVRDNRRAAASVGKAVGCTTGSGHADLYVPKSCVESEWIIHVVDGDQQMTVVSDESIPVADYFPFASDIARLMSDWAVVRPFRSAPGADDLAYAMETTLEPQGGSFMIDVIGRVQDVTVGGIQADLSSLYARNAGNLPILGASGYALSFEQSCPDGGRSFEPCINPTNESPAALRLTVTWPKAADARVVLTAFPADHGRADAAVADPGTTRDWQARTLRARSILVVCDALPSVLATVTVLRGADAGCSVQPRTPEPAAPSVAEDAGAEALTEAPPASPELILDGVQVLDASGNLTREALRLGYGDILGFGSGDLGSLAAYLARNPVGPDFSLTVRPGMQARMLDVISKYKGTGKRHDLVLLSAEGPDMGALLGFASNPGPAVGLSHWDLRVLAEVDPGNHPLAAHAWTAHDRFATPGSTFKLVTALAAIQQVLDQPDQDLEDILLGNAPPSKLVERFGLVQATVDNKSNICTIDGNAVEAANAMPTRGPDGRTVLSCIQNAGDALLMTHAMSGTGVGGNKPCRPGDNREHIGLCEAILRSSNLFFAGLSFDLGKALSAGDGAGRPAAEAVAGMAMSRIIRRLSASRIAKSDAVSVSDALDPGFALYRLRATPIQPEFMRVLESSGTGDRAQADNWLREIAFAGFGQTVSAAPLSMAAVAASIAAETVVHPHVVALSPTAPVAWTPLIDVPAGKEALYRALFDQLLNGMNGSVVGNGTGKKIVADLPAWVTQQVFAKTGTAQISESNKKEYAAWVVAFVRPPGQGSGITRTVAIACRVAPVRTHGGTECGPVVRDLIRDLHNNGL